MKNNKNSKSRIQANNRYNAKAYDRINIAVPKGRKATVEAVAAQNGESINALINRLLQNETGLTQEEWKNVKSEEADKEEKSE